MMGFYFYELYTSPTAVTDTPMARERSFFRRFFGRMWGRMN